MRLEFTLRAHMLLGILVLAGAAFYFMKADERAHTLRAARSTIHHALETIQGGPADAPFPTALRERTPWALVTPALIVMNVGAFAMMGLGSEPPGEVAALIAWGANTGPRTGNGEWVRLLTSMFVHSGSFQLLVNMAGLAAVGIIVERLAGSATFAAVYLAAGVFAGIVSLTTGPMEVSYGASGAVFGIYGLLGAVTIRFLLRRLDLTPTPAVLRRIATAAGLFGLYSLMNGSISITAELSGFGVGLVHGLWLDRGADRPKAAVRRVAPIFAATLLIATALGARVAGIDDLRPEVESLITTERRTAGMYEQEVERYKARKVSENRLVQVIDSTIIPELRAMSVRLNAIDKLLPEQRQLFENASAYLRLREQSWSLRADGLRQMVRVRRGGGGRALQSASLLALRQAETKERAALDALQGVMSDISAHP